ncbi:MAG TPA: DUF6159 family protein [Candidatus Thermoplasmatota archaeon]|nr:DUF6159 family protein [Candidatus Thermoplasmatota archaeon]
MAGKVRVPFRARYATSRAIFGQSWRMLRTERDLWVFPLLGLASMLAFAAVLVGVVVWGVLALGPSFLNLLHVPRGARPFLFFLAMPLMYPLMVLTSLFNAALCHAAHERLEGRPGRKKDAWRRAVAQLGPIARYNLLAMLVSGLLAVVGQLLDRLRIIPYIGQAFQTLGALAWAVAAYFVIPVLVVEGERSAIGALRTSTALARDQWGKATAGIVTIGLAVMVPMLLVFLPFLLFMMGLPLLMAAGIVSAKAMFPLVLTAGCVIVVASLAMGLFASMVGSLYQTALYRYARTGIVSLPFTPETLVDSWAPYRNK